MKPTEGSEFFSLAARRRLEADRVKARRAADAQATRIVARLACERRLRDVHALIAEAELRAVRRLARGKLAALCELARAIVKRLRDEDRPATVAAADEVALAIEGTPTAGAPKANGAPARLAAGEGVA